MFAFAIHDHARGCLFLARDRLGVKPLHYVRLSDGSVAFASELKGLLRHPLLRREANLSAVEDYFAFGYVPDDTSIVAGVEKLRSEEHTSELQSLMRISYAVFCLKKNNKHKYH